MLDKLALLRRERDLPLHVRHSATNHAKGIAGQHFLLAGSMNLTYSGVLIRDERIEYTTDCEQVALADAEFDRLWARAEGP